MSSPTHSSVRPAGLRRLVTALAPALLLLSPPFARAQDPARPVPPDAPVSTPLVACTSAVGGRQHCPADTSSGVVLQQETGTRSCILGNTWGYDQTGIWVSDGCGGEFQAGPATVSQGGPDPSGAAVPAKPAERIESWGEFEPGGGFLVGRSSAGELDISGYALVRYVNQSPGSQTFIDHLGNERTVDGRNDIYPHRVMVFFKGWLGSPKLIYAITFWTVSTTDQRAIFGNVGYQFSRRFSLYAGLNGNPGTRSLQGSHPYWLGHDRVMADEFFRPYFGSGVWAQGEVTPGLWYNAVMTNNNSSLGVKSSQLDRTFSWGASGWWMPTTKEFGPRGGYGDWEWHDKLATRFGVSWTWSPEERFTNASGAPENTTIRLADSVNLFDTGALASGVTVDRVDYRIVALDAGMKYRGIFLQTEVYNRWLTDLQADGVLPVTAVHDTGFYVQAAFFPVPKKIEAYGITSHVFGDRSAGFDTSSEYGGGMNYYPFNTRNHRLNVQATYVDRSPVSSAFGYYVGGLKGTSFSTAFSIFF
jgi:hypothetical protein